MYKLHSEFFLNLKLAIPFTIHSIKNTLNLSLGFSDYCLGFRIYYLEDEVSF